MGIAYAAKVQIGSLRTGIMIGSLVKVGKKLGIVVRRLKYGWVVRWNNGKNEIISWNTRERRWKAREKTVTILVRENKEHGKDKK